ncbi:MAG TPA: hypothetical protein VJ966_00665 [Actinomycetes bacterium]|nr:hypothetical protein [Actinomycetes bacterium]
MPYKTFAAGNVLAASDLNNGPYADAKTADVTTSQTTTSTTYTDLGTVGPAVTESLVAGQGVLVIISARMIHSAGAGASAKASFAVSGASTQAALDADAIESDLTTTAGAVITRATWYVATGTGSHTFTMKFKVVSSGTGTFLNRRIIVKKF